MSVVAEDHDVILVQPGVTWVYDPYEHLGLAYLAAALRSAGMTVKIVDAVLEQLKMSELFERLAAYRCRVLGVTLVSHGFPATARFAEQYRSRHPHTSIVAGGHFATFAAQKIFDHTPGFDAIVLGEGEAAFTDYCRAILDGEIRPQVANVALRGEPVRRTHVRATDLDALAFPARDMLSLALSRGAVTSVTASRGCYARCAFCTVSSFYEADNGPRWIARSIPNVIEEVTQLREAHGIDHFMFVDDNFMGPGRRGRERAVEFARAYGESGLPMTFHVDMRAIDVDEAVIAALVDVGLVSIFIGIESISNADLKLYRKDLEADANWRAIDIVNRFDLERTYSMIMFNPRTTTESIVENCRFLRRANFYPRNPISVLNVYEGTEHSYTFKDEVDGPFWDYRFAFAVPETDAIYRAALCFCRESLPYERAVSKVEVAASPLRQDLYRMRLSCLEDLALRGSFVGFDEVLSVWQARLSEFGASLPVDCDDDAVDLLFLPADTPVLGRPAKQVA